MDKDSVTAALRALATGSKRSKTAQMRDVFDDVDASLKSGVSREDVLKTLNEAGLDLTLRTFDTIVYRLRQERLGLGKAAPVTKKSASAATQPASRPDSEKANVLGAMNEEIVEIEIEENPLNRIAENATRETGDPRRNDVSFDNTPDLSKIYGKKE